MNAADDKERSDATPSCSSTSSNSNCNSSYSSDSNSGMCGENFVRNDCSGPLHSNGPVCNGARPKTQPLACNIPNGLSHNNYPLKLNNNVSVLDSDSKMHNGNGMDLYMRNNVDYCVPVDKCPSKVRNPINEGSENNSRFYKKDNDDSLSENEEEDEYCIYTYKGDQNQMADLPSSFFRLGVVPPGRENNEGRSSSPDMDYLEMDFDPGPSNGRGDSSEDSDCCDMQNDEERQMEEEDESPPEENRRQSASPVAELEARVENNDEVNENNEEPMNQQDDPFVDLHPYKNRKLGHLEERNENNQSYSLSDDVEEEYSQPSTSMREPKNDLSGTSRPTIYSQPPSVSSQQLQSSHAACSSFISPSTAQDNWGYHCSSGDLCSPGDPSENSIEEWGENAADYFSSQGDNSIDTRKYNLRSALYHCIMAKRLVLDKQASFTDSEQYNLVSIFD